MFIFLVFLFLPLLLLLSVLILKILCLAIDPFIVLIILVALSHPSLCLGYLLEYLDRRDSRYGHPLVKSSSIVILDGSFIISVSLKQVLLLGVGKVLVLGQRIG